MFREGTNQKAVYDWLASFENGESRPFDVADRVRPGNTINDVMARAYISAQSKMMGMRFKTKTKPDEDGRPRMHVERVL